MFEKYETKPLSSLRLKMTFHTHPALTTVCRMLQQLTFLTYNHLSTPHRRGESVEPTAYTANPHLSVFHTEWFCLQLQSCILISQGSYHYFSWGVALYRKEREDLLTYSNPDEATWDLSVSYNKYEIRPLKNVQTKRNIQKWSFSWIENFPTSF